MSAYDVRERGNWQVLASVMKWDDAERLRALGLAEATGDDLLRYGIEPDDYVEAPGNLLTTAGITRMLTLLIGGGGQAFNNANARIGVGNGTTAAAAGDTDLAAAAGATNRQFKLMDATYPTVSGASATFRASYADGEANFAWQEWGIDNGNVNGTTVVAPLLNRRVVSLGSKTSGIWTLTVTVTIA